MRRLKVKKKMEDLFSLSDKWIKTVAFPRVLTWSASGRPEVSFSNYTFSYYG